MMKFFLIIAISTVLLACGSKETKPSAPSNMSQEVQQQKKEADKAQKALEREF